MSGKRKNADGSWTAWSRTSCGTVSVRVLSESLADLYLDAWTLPTATERNAAVRQIRAL